MPARVRHHLDERAIRALLTSPTGPVAKDLLRRGLKVQAAARRNLAGASGRPRRVDTGLLRSSVTVRLVTVRGLPAARVGTQIRYARLVHDGTGIHGPRRRRIVPVRAAVLRFRPKGSARYIFRPSVAGMRPNPFLTDALPAARD